MKKRLVENEISYHDISGILSLYLPNFPNKNHLRFLVKIKIFRPYHRLTDLNRRGEAWVSTLVILTDKMWETDLFYYIFGKGLDILFHRLLRFERLTTCWLPFHGSSHLE